jgi:hypothetical protein
MCEFGEVVQNGVGGMRKNRNRPTPLASAWPCLARTSHFGDATLPLKRLLQAVKQGLCSIYCHTPQIWLAFFSGQVIT